MSTLMSAAEEGNLSTVKDLIRNDPSLDINAANKVCITIYLFLNYYHR